MITWTTPTIPIRVRGGNILGDNVRTWFTFEQDERLIDVLPTSMRATEDGVVCAVDLDQLQTGGFHAGAINVQVNCIDSNDYRAASSFGTVYAGSNLFPKAVQYGD